MSSEVARAYTESLIMLEVLKLINEVPSEIVEAMRKNRDENWHFEYDNSLPAEEQKMLRETIIVLSTIYLKYICKSQEEKTYLHSLYKENEEKRLNEYRAHEKNMFVSKLNGAVEGSTFMSTVNEEKVALISQKELGLMEKIIGFFRRIISRKY